MQATPQHYHSTSHSTSLCFSCWRQEVQNSHRPRAFQVNSKAINSQVAIGRSATSGQGQCQAVRAGEAGRTQGFGVSALAQESPRRRLCTSGRGSARIPRILTGKKDAQTPRDSAAFRKGPSRRGSRWACRLGLFPTCPSSKQ